MANGFWNGADGGPVRIGGRHDRLAMATLFFRHQPMPDRVGYLDYVRYAADSEIITCLRATFGRAGILRVNDVPYHASRRVDSMTSSRACAQTWRSRADGGVDKRLHCDRVRYNRAIERWHGTESAADRQLHVPIPPAGPWALATLVRVADGYRERENPVSIFAALRMCVARSAASESAIISNTDAVTRL